MTEIAVLYCLVAVGAHGDFRRNATPTRVLAMLDEIEASNAGHERTSFVLSEKLAENTALKAEVERMREAQYPRFGLGECMSIAARGLLRWAEKEHNHRWWKRIDGTPIINDVPVVIAEEFSLAITRARQALGASDD